MDTYTRFLKVFKLLRIFRVLYEYDFINSTLNYLNSNLKIFLYIAFMFLIFNASTGMLCFLIFRSIGNKEFNEKFSGFLTSMVSINSFINFDNWSRVITVYNSNEPIMTTFAVCVTIIVAISGNFILLNILLALILDEFSKSYHDYQRYNEDTSNNFRKKKIDFVMPMLTEKFTQRRKITNYNLDSPIGKGRSITRRKIHSIKITKKSLIPSKIMFKLILGSRLWYNYYNMIICTGIISNAFESQDLSNANWYSSGNNTHKILSYIVMFSIMMESLMKVSIKKNKNIKWRKIFKNIYLHINFLILISFLFQPFVYAQILPQVKFNFI